MAITERFLSDVEILTWVDEISRARFGVSATEFAELYGRGVFWDKPVAHDIACVLPLLVRRTDGGDAR